MVKSIKQNKHLGNIGSLKKEATEKLVEATCRYVLDNPEIDHTSWEALAKVSKIIDPERKGRSAATFKSDYLKAILFKYRVGPYTSLENEDGSIDPLEYIELKKSVNKLELELKEKKKIIRDKSAKIKELERKNEKLRHDNMGLLTTLELSGQNIAVNNIKHK